MDNIEIITAAVNDADLGDESTGMPADVPETPETSEPETVVTDPPPAVETDPVKEVVAETKKDADDLTAEELLSLGIKPPKPGEKPGKFTHDRVVKMIGKAVKAERTARQKALDEQKTTYAKTDEELTRFRKLDQLATTDPEKYVRVMGSMFPEKYGRFVEFLNGTAAKPVVATGDQKLPDEKDDPKPAPDAQFPDGTAGYSPDQHEKLLQWFARSTHRQVMAAVDQRMKPVTDQTKAAEAYNQRLARVKADIQDMQETWGEFYPKPNSPEEADLAKYINEHPHLTFKQAVRAWVEPRITTKRSDIRSEVMKEVSERGKRQERTPVTQTKTVRDPNEARPSTDIIFEAMAAAGLK